MSESIDKRMDKSIAYRFDSIISGYYCKDCQAVARDLCLCKTKQRGTHEQTGSSEKNRRGETTDS